MFEQAQRAHDEEMSKKDKDAQDMMALMDEALQKNGRGEGVWEAKFQKLQMEMRDLQEHCQAVQLEVVARDDTIAKLRKDLGKSQVVNRRLSSHFSTMREDEDDFPTNRLPLDTQGKARFIDIR